MKIFFPIIAALILLCLGSCGYANYCKQPVEHNEDEEVDRHEEVYDLSKPDRPYLTPHYQELLITFFDSLWNLVNTIGPVQSENCENHNATKNVVCSESN